MEVERTECLERILALPRRKPVPPPGLAEQMTELLKTPEGKMTLRPLQALALHDIGVCGGAFLPLDVGEGKTLVSLLAPYVLDAQRPLLLLPANLIQKTAREMRELAKSWVIPNHIRMISYQMLGLVQSARDLELYAPDVIVMDESQKLKNRDAAVTRRVERYLDAHPDTKVVAMTGTIMRRSLRDFAHVLRWALKRNAPVPLDDAEVDLWALALDERIENEWQRVEPGALLHLVDTDDHTHIDPTIAARRAFRIRLRETPGVVASAESGTAVDAGLTIRALRYDVGAITSQHFKRLRDEKVAPDGWELWEAADAWRVAKELALGFHYVQVDAEKYATWLTQTISASTISSTGKRNSSTRESTTTSTEQRSVPSSASGGSAIPSDTRQVASGTTRSTKSSTPEKGELDGSQRSTDSPSSSSRLSDRSKEEAALSADVSLKPFTSTTTIRQGSSEGSCAAPAIARLGYSETMSPLFKARFATFVETARPPEAWREARRNWFAFVRAVLSRSRTYDSPEHVAQACDAGKLPTHALDAWRAVRDSFCSTTIALWHDDSALRVCAEWMETPGLVWTEHQFFAHGLAEYTGCKYYGAKGLSDDGEFIDDAPGDKSIIVSMDANREGRNLQRRWYRNLVTSPQEGADVWQQLLGRTHRPWQERDVEVDVLLGCMEHAKAWQKACAGALAIRDTVGAESKLLIADVDWPDADEVAGWSGPRWGK